MSFSHHLHAATSCCVHAVVIQLIMLYGLRSIRVDVLTGMMADATALRALRSACVYFYCVYFYCVGSSPVCHV